MSRWYRAALTVHGDFDPSALDLRLGQASSVSRRKGDPFARGRLRNEIAFWSLRSPLGDELQLDQHLGWLLDRLEPKQAEITSLQQACAVRLFCGVAAHDTQAGSIFAPALLNRLAAFGVPLILDLYPPDGQAQMEADAAKAPVECAA